MTANADELVRDMIEKLLVVDSELDTLWRACPRSVRPTLDELTDLIYKTINHLDTVLTSLDHPQ